MPVARNITLLKWFNFFTDFRFYAPVAILYFTQVAGSFALGMSVFSIHMLSAALLEVPTGVFSDKIGRKWTMVLGAVVSVIGITLYAIGGDYSILVAGAICLGLARSFYSGNNDALLHDTLRDMNKTHEYHHFYGVTHSMFQTALAAASILGGFIAYYSFPATLWLSVLSQCACVVISSFIIEPKQHSHESANIYEHITDSIKNFIKNPKLRLLSLSHTISFAIGEAVFDFQSAFYNTLWPVWAIGIAKTASNVMAALSYYFGGRIVDRFGPFRILLGSALYNRTVNMLAVIFPTLLSPILMSSSSILYGASGVAKNTLMQKEYTDHQRATMDSLNSFLGSVLFAIVSFGIGLLADTFSAAQSILILQLISFIVVVLYIKMFSK